MDFKLHLQLLPNANLLLTSRMLFQVCFSLEDDTFISTDTFEIGLQEWEGMAMQTVGRRGNAEGGRMWPKGV